MPSQIDSKKRLPRDLQVDSQIFRACAVENKCDDLYEAYQQHFDKPVAESAHPSKVAEFQENVRHLHQQAQQQVSQEAASRQTSEESEESSAFSPRLYKLALNPVADRPPPRPSTVSRDDYSRWESMWEDSAFNNEFNFDVGRRLGKTFSFRRLSGLEAILEIGSKIYYPKPFKKQRSGHRRYRREGHTSYADTSSHTSQYTSAHGVATDPPPEVRLTRPVPLDERDGRHPFGDTLRVPRKATGREVDLRTSPGFDQSQIKSARTDPFLKYLNWGTADNPDGIPLVHNVFDQGNCGSCWAYAATGSLEASASRQAARDAYQEKLDALLTQNTYENGSFESDHRGLRRRHKRRQAREIAEDYARWVEQTTFANTNLSIQELIDCDTPDRGCVGGNPLMAFIYIHQYGLVSWDDYPYAAEESTCQRSSKDVSLPRATVASWGILPKNHEDMIEIGLRYIGPVAVGINGADRDFISYDGGIFDKKTCHQDPNHAMLIVGYGEEEVEILGYNETVRYWIARNSWGTDWGEDGYMRIGRGPGDKHVPGICGIARSPSVALGGRVLFSVQPNKFSDQRNETLVDVTWNDHIAEDPVDFHDYFWSTLDEGTRLAPFSCQHLLSRYSSKSWLYRGCYQFSNAISNHRAATLGILGILMALILVAWPLSMVCRRRRRVKRARRQSSSTHLAESDESSNTVENNDSHAVDEGIPLNISENEHSPLLSPSQPYRQRPNIMNYMATS